MDSKNKKPEDLALLVAQKLKDAKTVYAIPSTNILVELFEILFYTSLKTEEGQLIKVTITFIDPKNPDPNPPLRILADRWKYIHFEKSIPFTVKNLVKLSKAADVWSSSIAVYYNEKNELLIWGMIDQSIHYHSFINYESDSGPDQPGLFQSTINGIGNIIVMFDYELIANLKQESLTTNYINVLGVGAIKEIIENNSSQLRTEIMNQLSNEFQDRDFSEASNYIRDILTGTLSRILLRIQNYRHGGAILITNKITSDLDIKYKVSYNRLKNAIINVTKQVFAYSIYSESVMEDYVDNVTETIPVSLYLNESVAQFESEEAKSELKGAIRYVASLSCVDGLVILDSELVAKGFGTVIRMKEIPKTIYISKTANVNPLKLIETSSDNFGTRHRSMFSHCWNNKGSVGFVISQDGDVRAVTRIDSKLILWDNIKTQRNIRSNKLKRPLLKKK